MKFSIAHAAWLRSWFACTLTLLPAFGLACDVTERKACEQRIVALVTYRTEAIEHAFGDLSAALPDQVRVKFVGPKDPQHPLAPGAIAYDREQHVLFMSRSLRDAKLPNPLRAAASYWPFYEQQQARNFRLSRRSTTRCGTPTCRQRRPPAASSGTLGTVAPPMSRSGCRARWSAPRSLTSSRHVVCPCSTRTASTACGRRISRLRGAQLAPRRVRVSGRAALWRLVAGSAADR